MADEPKTIGSIIEETFGERTPEEELEAIRGRFNRMEKAGNETFKREVEKREALAKRVR